MSEHNNNASSTSAVAAAPTPVSATASASAAAPAPSSTAAMTGTGTTTAASATTSATTSNTAAATTTTATTTKAKSKKKSTTGSTKTTATKATGAGTKAKTKKSSTTAAASSGGGGSAATSRRKKATGGNSNKASSAAGGGSGTASSLGGAAVGSSGSGATGTAKSSGPTAGQHQQQHHGYSHHQQVLQEARAAQANLTKLRAEAAAKKSDPLWYRIEDILPAQSASADAILGGISNSSCSSILPEQVSIVEAALQHHHLSRSDVTPQAMACLLEQARRFAQELLSNAQDYAYSANRPEVSPADLQLAAEMRSDHMTATITQLPKLNLVAQQINRAPLPPIPTECYSGILLPPQQHQLTARTYDIVTGAEVARKMLQKLPSPPSDTIRNDKNDTNEPTNSSTGTKNDTKPISTKKKSSSASLSSSSSQPPSYGASRGRQIPIKLKEKQAAADDAAAKGGDSSNKKSSTTLGSATGADTITKGGLTATTTSK